MFRSVAREPQVEGFKFPERSSEPIRPGEVLIRKMKAFINLMDMDGDGFLTRNDMLLLAERFRSVGNLEPGRAEEALRLRKRAWGMVFCPEDFDDKLDGEKLAQQLLKAGRDTIISFASMNFCFAFDLIDKDGSGFITRKELRQYHLICNVADERVTEESFHVMDVDKDGKIPIPRDFIPIPCTIPMQFHNSYPIPMGFPWKPWEFPFPFPLHTYTTISPFLIGPWSDLTEKLLINLQNWF